MAWQDLPGFFDFDWLYAGWAKEARPNAVFVELGVYLGRSLAFMHEALKDRPDVQIWGVDNWAVDGGREGWGGDSWPDHPGDPRAQAVGLGGPFNSFAACMHAAARPALERCYLVRCNSALAARLFDDGGVDFVFIDADHSYEAVKADLAAWLPKVRTGGLIAGHDHSDLYYPGVVRAVRETFGGNFKTPGPGSSWVVQI
jgi:hypothetical protein